MAADMTVDLSEIEAFARTVDTSGPRLGARAAKAVRDTAKDVESTMKSSAPVDTGRLRDSISTEYEGDGRSREFTATIGPSVDYARFVVNGTAFVAPNPFPQQAAEAHQRDFDKRIDSAAEKVI